MGLRDIVRLVLLAEVREFVSTSTSVKRDVPSGSARERREDDVPNDRLVQEIRNALMMPQGAEEHARILLSGAGIEPDLEGQREYVPGVGETKTSSLSHATRELQELDRHMSDVVARSFGRLRGEAGPGAVNLPRSARSGSLGAYDTFIRALESGFSSTVDTEVSRRRGGKVQMGPLTPMKDEDLVDVLVDDMIEVLLSPSGDPDRLDFERVEEEMQRLVDSLIDEEDDKAAISSKLSAAFKREIDSARSKATRQERERGARVPDQTVRKMISNVEGLLKLFVSRVVMQSDVPQDEYGRAFAAIASRACGIEDDYKLPPSISSVRIEPILPQEVDRGIVDFVREVHSELMRSIDRMPYLRMAYHVIVDAGDLYDEDGHPTPQYTFDEPHPAYDR